ncbi:hypothetical protein AWC07_01870 [Mycobacterium gastri]|uniref:Uncharacterized protein n=1 Tax=Mycobacterium gastri TaxID=1777 RepID=A0A1X1VYS3_MYCGS|nr:hypothetical protein AWC07_01870 [Mycobacterium gastri]
MFSSYLIAIAPSFPQRKVRIKPGTVHVGIRTDEPIPWQFQRLGHISLGDRVLAVSASDRAREQRITAREAAKEGA